MSLRVLDSRREDVTGLAGLEVPWQGCICAEDEEVYDSAGADDGRGKSSFDSMEFQKSQLCS